jgi:hypothetical protein
MRSCRCFVRRRRSERRSRRSDLRTRPTSAAEIHYNLKHG